MPQTLSEIVNAALTQADASIKVASLRDAPIEDRTLARVDAYLAKELGQVAVEPAQESAKTASGQAEASQAARTSQYDDVRFALKLAEALEHGAHVVEKLALEGPLNKSTGGAPKPGPTPAAGPAKVLKQPFENAKVVSPRPQASAKARAVEADKSRLKADGTLATDEHFQLNEGPVIPRNYPNGRNITNHKNSKHAALGVGVGPALNTAMRDEARKTKGMGAIGGRLQKKAELERLLRSKIAQHRMLVSLGRIDAANQVLKEAAELSNVGSAASLERVGASNDQSMLVFKDDYGAARFPDNEGVRNLTKAQARDANQREAASFWGEPVKRDNAVAAHSLTTEGLKLSARRKLARGSATTPGLHESFANHASAIRANAPLQTVGSGLAGGVLGGMLGHTSGRGRAATAIGAGLGALGAGALGYHSAKGEQAMRQRLYEQGRASRGKQASLGAMKVSGIGDLAGAIGRGAARMGGKVLGKADEGLHHLRMGKIGPQRQSLLARGQQGLAGLSEGAQKGLGYGVMGAGALGAAGTGYAMTR